MPVKFFSSPGAGLLVEALDVARLGLAERRVDVDLDELALGASARGPSRARRGTGEMKAVSTIRPASAISLATSPTRRMFSTRSASVKPRSLFSPWRTLSPSSRKVCRFIGVQLLLDQVGDGRLAGAREAGEPQHRRLLALERRRACSRLTSSACQWTFCARRRRSGSCPRRRWRWSACRSG